MSDSQTPWDEGHLAEDPAVDLLRHHLGNISAAPEHLDTERQSLTETVLPVRLGDCALERLDPWLSEANC